MQDLDWNDLRFVLAAARCQSLAGAARQLGVNESTVGRRITRIEQRLASQLFERGAGVLHVTKAGAAVVASAERIERDVQDMAATIGGVDNLAAGAVRLTSVPMIVNRVLVPALPRLLDCHPDLRVDLIAEPRVMSLTKREADLALRLARPQKEMRAVARRVGQVDYAVYAAVGTTQDQLPWVTYDDGMADLPQRQWIAEQAKGGDGAPPVMTANDAEAIFQAVKAGLGKSLLPIAIADRDGDLVRLGERAVALSRELWLVVHPDLRHLTRIRVVMDWVATAVAGLARD
ncbi:MAG: LysR family transcriptional regulator [Pseudomonadota bacterium]